MWLHRDLKPSNVILSVDGPRVIDLGIAHRVGGTVLTRTGMMVGTRSWMAPEQWLGASETEATDMFTWACLVVFAATGRHPFGQGRPDAVGYRIVHHPPDLEGLDLLDYRLRECVARCLGKGPGQRPTASQVLAAITGHTGAEPTTLDRAAATLAVQAWINAPAAPGTGGTRSAEAGPLNADRASARAGSSSAPTAADRRSGPATQLAPPPVPGPDPSSRLGRRVGVAVAGLLLVPGMAWAVISLQGSAPPATTAESPTTAPSEPAAESPRPPIDEYPAYPGPVDVGATGAAAAMWQEILIRCGAISDIPANRDRVYGPKSGEIVRRLESNWGWAEADTMADRLTYNRIVQKGCA